MPPSSASDGPEVDEGGGSVEKSSSFRSEIELSQAEAILEALGEPVTPERLRLVQETVLTQFAHKGPLPHETWFDGVEVHYPGATRAMITNYIAQEEHQRLMMTRAYQLDRAELFLNAALHFFRHLIAAGIAFMGIGSAAWLTDHGHSLSGLSVFVVDLATLVALFVKMNRRK